MPPVTYSEQCDRLAAATKEIDAILAASDAEARQMTPEEIAQTDTLSAECEGLKTSITTYEKTEELRKAQAARRDLLARPRPTSTTPPTPGGATKLPATPRNHYGSLTAFKGPTADADAYLSGQFVLASLGYEPAKAWCREHLANVQSEGIAVYGGYVTLPSEFERAIIDLRDQYSVFRREANVRPMVSDSLTIPRKVGGLSCAFIGENAEITQSDAEWTQVKLVAQKAAVMARFSSELNEDAIISMADTLANDGAYAIAQKEDQCGFIGDGTSTYGGMYGVVNKLGDAANATYAGSLYTAITGNTAFSTLDLADFESMVGKLPVYAEAGARWFISKAGFAASMLRLIDAAGGQTGEMIAGRAPSSFLGYPVVFVSVMNTTLTAQTSTNGLVLFGNMKQTGYLGDRRALTIKTSDQRYIEYDQIAIQMTQRFDCVNVVGDQLAPTTAAGPMLMLVTPGS